MYLDIALCASLCDFSYLQSLFGDDIPQSEKARAFELLARSKHGRDVVWEHLNLNWRTDPVPEG
jgi:hypothetical protein